MTVTLQRAQLDELEALWRAQGAEIAGCLADGLSDQEMDRLAGSAGIELPGEARVWYGWHNGVAVSTARGWDIGPNIGFRSLEQTLEEYRRVRPWLVELGWPSTLLPILDYPRGMLAIDWTTPLDAPAAVQWIDFEIEIFPGAPSMGEMVRTWVTAINSGAWTWGPDGYWIRDKDQLPAWAQERHVT